MSYRETGLHPDADKRHQEARTPTRIERLQYVDAERFAPWALYLYDRPITAGRVWTPVGWPREATAMKLTAEEIERYRERDALALELSDLVAVDLELPADLHARLLPPGLEAGSEPLVRILALDIAKSDVSTLAFHEVWLLARCRREGRASWYAMSHLVGPDGDVVSGRETFGYPSRMASIEWSRERDSFALAASRLGRRVASLVVSTTDRSERRADDDVFDVVGLRLHPAYRVMTESGFEEPGPRAELVAQPWTFALDQLVAIEPTRLVLELPAEPGPGRIGKPDPWYELAAGSVARVIRGRGALRRGPGRVLATLDAYMPWYAERLDGTLDSAKATSGDVTHTFLVGPG